MSRPTKRLRLSLPEAVHDDQGEPEYGTDDDIPSSSDMYPEEDESEAEDEEDELEVEEEQDEDKDNQDEEDGDKDSQDEDSDGDDDQDDEEDEDSDDDDDDDQHNAPRRDPVRDELRQISFGALLDAQTSLPAPKIPQIRRHGASTGDPSAKVNILRERLAELKALKKNSRGDNNPSSTSTSAQKPQQPDTAQRSHKHAPMEQSSKYQVTRKRAAVLTSSNPYHARDPRFSAVSGTPATASTIRQNYAFLSDYGVSELAELKAAAKTTKSPADKDALKREITVRESKARAEEGKERERRVLAAHRKEEKEAVAQGKKPYFLKREELRKRVLVDKFESMKGKERERAMTRRRKKESQRERRNMPNDRRGVA